MYQRQRNARASTAHIPESLAPDGTLLAARAVDPGDGVDWPFPLAGFEGWVEPGEDSIAEPVADEPAAKSRSKASAKAADAPEVAS